MTFGKRVALRTRYKSCSYYVSWFFRLYECTDTGWWLKRTKDGRGIEHQDAFFMRALEIINNTMNQVRKEEMDRQLKKR